MSDHDPIERQALRYKFFYSMAALVLGLLIVLGGIVLFLNGVVGSTSWTAKIIGIESSISDAAPGAVLFVVGLFGTLVFGEVGLVDSPDAAEPRRRKPGLEALRRLGGPDVEMP